MCINNSERLVEHMKKVLDECMLKVASDISMQYSMLGKICTDNLPVLNGSEIQSFITIFPFRSDCKGGFDDVLELVGEFSMSFCSRYVRLVCDIGSNLGQVEIDIADKKIDFANFHNPEKELSEIVQSICNKMKECFLNLVPEIDGNLFRWLKEVRNSSNKYFNDTANELMKENNYQEAIKIYRHILREQLSMTDYDWRNYADCAKELGLADEYKLAVARQ